jgi:oxalate---CoA ligase
VIEAAAKASVSGQDWMRARLSKCRGIKDVELGLHWDSATLLDEVNRRAAVLSRKGIGSRSVVAIAHSGTARFFADLFATWSVGASAACLDSTLTAPELQNVVSFADAAVLLVDGDAVVSEVSVPVVDLGGAPSASVSHATPAIDPDDPALILFTSGTTGTPKGVVLTFGALLARIDANIVALGAATLQRALVTLPTYFGHGLIGNSLTPLFAGGEIILHPRGMPLINKLGAIIDEHDVSFMSSVPSLWRLALDCSRPPAGRSLLRVHVGSAPLSTALWSEIARWSGAEVVNCYGITETANWIAGASSGKDGIIEGLVGHLWGGSAAVLDESGSISNQGAGEIVIQSPCLMSGYLKRPDLTTAAFHDGWFRTGDQGSIDEQGRIWVTGRIKDEINRGGFKVQPAEVDSLLEGHPAVAEACVFGIPDPMGGEAVAAAVRLAEGKSATPLSLQAWCSQRLRRAAVPEHWFFVPEIPRTARGKVSRDVVRRTLTQDSKVHVKSDSDGSATADVAITTDRERELLGLWQEILGVEGLGVEDDYFALGGTSLMVARLFAEISRRFGIRLPLSTILEAPTVRALSRHVVQEATSTTGLLIELKRGGPRTLFIIHDGVGETLLYLNLARRMPNDLAVIGIKPRALPRVPLAHTSVEDMASFYIEEMRRRQPHGPYLLAGMCAGGIIAYEMATQLLLAGESVEFVALLDAVTPQTPKTNPSASRKQMLAGFKKIELTRANRAASVIRALYQKVVHAFVWRFWHYRTTWFRRLRFGLLRTLLLHDLSWPSFVPELKFDEIFYFLQTRYSPKPLSIPSIVLARATSGEGVDMPYSRLYADEALGWTAVAKNLTVVDVEGGHESMLREPFVASLAGALLPYVQQTPVTNTPRIEFAQA